MVTRQYARNRISQALITILAVISLSFGLIYQLPGGPEAFLLVKNVGGTDAGGEDYAQKTQLAQFNLDAPVHVQYQQYVTSVLQGDLGISFRYGEPVLDILLRAAPWTIFLMGTALVLTYAIGIVLGALFAYNQNTRLDSIGTGVSTFLNSIPYYLLAVLVVYVLGFQLEVLPTRGRYASHLDPGFNVEFIISAIRHALIPGTSVVVTAFGFRALAMRGNSIQVLGKPFVRVAELRGLSDNRITTQYVGRNAVLPMYTGFMITIGFMFSAAVILEQIFQYRGVGWYLLQAIRARDYPLMMGAFILMTLFVVIGLLIADLTYGLIDPRASTGNKNGSSGSSLKELIRRLQRTINQRRRAVSSETPSRYANGGIQHPGRQTSIESGSDSVFKTSVDTQRSPASKAETYYGLFDEYVLESLRIIRDDKRTLVGSSIIGFYLLFGLAILFLPSPAQYKGEALLPIGHSLAHPLGTDGLGRDLMLLSIYATGPILKMVFSGAVFATTLATIIGLVSGYARGFVDRVLMTITDIVLSIPGLPLLVVLAAIFQPENPYVIGVLLTINAWGGIARQIRSQVLTLRGEMYVEASEVISLSPITILLKDILPNIMPFVAVKFVQLGRRVIFASVALYFLGILPTDIYNWGVTLYTAFKTGALYSFSTVHWIVVPIASVVLLTYGMVLLSQGMDKIFNPRIRAEDDDSAI